MKAIEVFKKVLAEGVQLARPTKGQPGEYDCKSFFGDRAKPIRRTGWVMVDQTTAHAVTSVHAALNPANQAKFETLDLLRMVDVTWKLVK